MLALNPTYMDPISRFEGAYSLTDRGGLLLVSVQNNSCGPLLCHVWVKGRGHISSSHTVCCSVSAVITSLSPHYRRTHCYRNVPLQEENKAGSHLHGPEREMLATTLKLPDAVL